MPENSPEHPAQENFEFGFSDKFVLGCLSIVTGLSVSEAVPLVPSDLKVPVGLGAAALLYEGGKLLARTWVRHSDRRDSEVTKDIDNRGDL